MAKTEENKVTEAAFLKSLNANKQAAATAAKKKRPDGLLNDMEILNKLGIEPNDSRMFNAAVSKITFSFAKDDPNRPMFRFVYVITEPDDPAVDGTIIANNHILEEGTNKDGEVWRTLEEAYEKLYFEFQGLGEDTASWKDPAKECLAKLKEHTANKTPIELRVSHWVSKDKQKSGMNATPSPIAPEDNGDIQIEDEEATNDPADETQYEDVDPPEATEADAEFNPDDWVGGWAEFDHEEYGHVVLMIESYDADEQLFYGTDENGEEWSAENGYGAPFDAVSWSDKNG